MSHTLASGRTLKVSASPGVANFFNTGMPHGPPPPNNLLYPNPLPPPPDTQYNVMIRGQHFKLNYEMITYDQPNLFTSSFLGGFPEFGEGRALTILNRSPALFSVIYEYLSGYAILPNPDIDLRNLLSDCEFYGLQRLKDELTLPKIAEELSSRHKLSRVVRFEDVASRDAQNIEWTEDGLMDANDPSKHLLVFVTNVKFKLDITVRASGECCQNLMMIELPPYAASLSSKRLNLTGVSQMDWTAVVAEALHSTPFTLNDEFEGNFGDFTSWMGSFMTRYSGSTVDGGSMRAILGPQDSHQLDGLTKAMPSWADLFRLKACQGHNVLQLVTSFWASEMSIIIAPPDDFDSTTSHMDSHPDDCNFVAKILNCSLSTGLHRRKAVKALVNL